ncbi:MAG: hypothetical protein Q8O67_15075 [Deltaproteobacteria bacterium]|nr:hypothetical protein [Deltaproteobacteria bacterium]
MGKQATTAATRFSGAQRFFLGVLALVAFTMAAGAWVYPPKRDVVGTGATAGVVTVHADPIAVTTALLAFGALAAFFCIDGRRVKSFAVPGASTEFADSEALAAAAVEAMKGANPDGEAGTEEAPENTTPTQGPVAEVSLGGAKLAVFLPNQIPPVVLADFVTQLHARGDSLPTLDAIELIARSKKPKNHPWFFKMRGSDTLWKLSYGGRGKAGPTLTLSA